MKELEKEKQKKPKDYNGNIDKFWYRTWEKNITVQWKLKEILWKF